MADGTWTKTACILCYVNCGLEVAVDGRRITKVKGDRANHRSQGYLCQKAQRLQWYGDHADRLTTPLRRRPDGTHEPIRGTTSAARTSRRCAVPSAPPSTSTRSRRRRPATSG